MSKDLLGTRRFAVVKDCFDQHQDRMHLDCTFSVLHDKLVVLDDYICSGMGLRYVDEWIDVGADAVKSKELRSHLWKLRLGEGKC